MKGRELPAVVSTPTPQVVGQAFADACWALGLLPTHEMLAVLLAHSALETGHWKLLRGFNFGNVKATQSYLEQGGDWTYYEASENLTEDQVKAERSAARPRTDGKPGLDMEVRGQGQDGRFACWFWPSHRQARFRAYPTLPAAALAYIRKLLDGYPAALTLAMSGDVGGYADHLQGYFTADAAKYKALLLKLFAQYLPVAQTIELEDPYERHEHTPPGYCV